MVSLIFVKSCSTVDSKIIRLSYAGSVLNRIGPIRRFCMFPLKCNRPAYYLYVVYIRLHCRVICCNVMFKWWRFQLVLSSKLPKHVTIKLYDSIPYNTLVNDGLYPPYTQYIHVLYSNSALKDWDNTINVPFKVPLKCDFMKWVKCILV